MANQLGEVYSQYLLANIHLLLLDRHLFALDDAHKYLMK